MSYWAAGNRITGDRFAKYMQAGTATVGFTTLSSTTVSVTFPIAFSAAPVVTVNIASQAAATAGWIARAVAVTATGFTLYLAATDGATDTWTNVAVGWVAVSP